MACTTVKTYGQMTAIVMLTLKLMRNALMQKAGGLQALENVIQAGALVGDGVGVVHG